MFSRLRFKKYIIQSIWVLFLGPDSNKGTIRDIIPQETKEQTKPKASRKKEIIKIRAEINERTTTTTNNRKEKKSMKLRIGFFFKDQQN